MKNNKNTNKSIGLFDVLLVIFIVLKLTGLVDWSWWWVLSPIWIAVLILLFGFIVALIIKGVRKK